MKVSSVDQNIHLEVMSEKNNYNYQIEDFVGVKLSDVFQEARIYDSTSSESNTGDQSPNTDFKNFTNVVQCVIRDKTTSEDFDFVWVQMSEVPTEARMRDTTTSQENSRDCLTDFGTDTNVLQYVNNTIVNDDTDENDLWSHDESEFEIEINVIRKYKKSQNHPLNLSKIKYTKPYYLKDTGHSTYKDKKEEKHNVRKQNNELIPKIKFDASTIAVLEMLINKRYIAQYNEIVGTGRNSVVFYAYFHDKVCMNMMRQNVVKVYKITKDETRNEVIYKKVKKEFKHLSILADTKNLKYNVPLVVRSWKNGILMSIIGSKEHVTPTIEAVPYEKDDKIYHDIIDIMDRFYNITHLVHGKLCPQNILVWCERPHFIGWSHSVKKGHPLALRKLMRDCHFVTEFYKRRGLKVISSTDLYQQITKKTNISENLLKIVEGNDLHNRYDTNPNRRTENLKQSTYNRFKLPTKGH